MGNSAKTLDGMRANPRADWQIEDVNRVCRRYGLTCSAPRRGGHYKVSHPNVSEILTIPAHRPIQHVYIRRLIAMIDATAGRNEEP